MLLGINMLLMYQNVQLKSVKTFPSIIPHMTYMMSVTNAYHLKTQRKIVLLRMGELYLQCLQWR